jgi:hypothetical protein
MDESKTPNPFGIVPLSNFVPRGFGFVRLSIAILYHEVPTLSHDSQLLHRSKTLGSAEDGSDASVAAGGAERPAEVDAPTATAAHTTSPTTTLFRRQPALSGAALLQRAGSGRCGFASTGFPRPAS